MPPPSPMPPILKSTGLSLVILLLLSIGALGMLEVSPMRIVVVYPWGGELIMPSEWALVLGYFEGGLLGIFLLSFFRKIGEKMETNKENSPQKLAWKLEDALTRIQLLRDENMQLTAFNETLKQAVASQETSQQANLQDKDCP